MRSVQLDEFSRRPAEYLESGESLSIERDGRVIGRYVPVSNGTGREVRTTGTIEIAWPRATEEERREALARFDEAVEQVLAESGMTREELADLLDLSRPFPYD
jgi:hypothetical protein